ncbi:MAG: polyprenyl synthetase family protein, partial [Rhodospirillales bacterium]|nr:polyprenyl synthetase family protein [Rhodospirillales bacterium]
MKQELSDFLEHYGKKLEAALVHWLPCSAQPGMDRPNEAIHYAVFPGGKRMRPLFTLLAVKTVGGEPECAMPIACAIEYLHTSSLIFDDLPSMDNAALRRGRKPVHLVYGEGLAILAALALFNQTYALIGKMADQMPDRNQILQLFGEATHCIGPEGMIGGQALDIQVGASADEALKPIQYLKTTTLTRLMFSAGAIVAGAPMAESDALAKVGEEFGLAYQIMDDLMDAPEDDHGRELTGVHLCDLNPELEGELHWREAVECLGRAQSIMAGQFLGDRAALLLKFAEMIFGALQDEISNSRKLRGQPPVRL